MSHQLAGDGRSVRQLANPLLMQLPAMQRRGTCCYSPIPSPTEPLGHGDFGPNGTSVFFPPGSHFTKPTDVCSTAVLLRSLRYVVKLEIRPVERGICPIAKSTIKSYNSSQ